MMDNGAGKGVIPAEQPSNRPSYNPHEETGTAVSFGGEGVAKPFITSPEDLYQFVLLSSMDADQLGSTIAALHEATQCNDYETASELLMRLVGSAAIDGEARWQALMAVTGGTVSRPTADASPKKKPWFNRMKPARDPDIS